MNRGPNKPLISTTCSSLLACLSLGRFGFSKPIVIGVALVLLSVALLSLPAVNALTLVWTNYTPSPSGDLNSVYCVSANDCWAVGFGGVTLHWDGTSWTSVSTPLGHLSTLTSVFCVTTSDCYAVGAEVIGAGPQTILQWNGAAWAIVFTNTVMVGRTVLNSVYCVSATDCWATGDTAVTLHGSGPTWTSITNPLQPPSVDFFFSVFCVSTNDCWAVTALGSIINWNGVAWGAWGAPLFIFESVYCVGASDCWIVGSDGLIDHWNGFFWVSFTSPLTPTTNTLWSVFCVDASDCWAVGDAGTIIQFNGSSWVIVTSPTSNALHGVFVDSGWAVGDGGTIIRGEPPAVATTTTTAPPPAVHPLNVGGEMLPVNMLRVVAPWIAAMLGLAVVAVETLVIKRRNNR